jgi:putative transcriptional regulator
LADTQLNIALMALREELMSDAAVVQSLKDHFLIAMPGLSGSIFAHSLTYLCEHSEEGAMGIIVNHPLDLCWGDVFEQLQLRGHCNGDQIVIAGGPVHTDRGFILHPADSQSWESSLAVTEDVALTTSLDIISALAAGSGPPKSLMALGYAGWAAGQLEEELADNCWLTLPADLSILFDAPFERKAAMAAATLGINLDLLSSEAGHA